VNGGSSRVESIANAVVAQDVSQGRPGKSSAVQPQLPTSPGTTPTLPGKRGPVLLAGGTAAVGVAAVIVLLVTHAFGGGAVKPATTAPSINTGPPIRSLPPVAERIVDNKDVFAVNGSPCLGPAVLHLSWLISPPLAGSVAVVRESGPGLPSTASYTIGSNGSFGADYTIQGSGTWITDVMTIGGRPAPVANSHNSASATCAPVG
jgi:hypothetical protein